MDMFTISHFVIFYSFLRTVDSKLYKQSQFCSCQFILLLRNIILELLLILKLFFHCCNLLSIQIKHYLFKILYLTEWSVNLSGSFKAFQAKMKLFVNKIPARLSKLCCRIVIKSITSLEISSTSTF